ncbi:hypothetical protein HYV64_00430 [Candidatus Shapirobacteria bacterium]|nr:hypothetical protein [Candidatus Shapirobacteria bacterium]
MKQRIVSVDFDGVIIEKLWGRDWTQQKKVESGQMPKILKLIDLWWRQVNQRWRRPIEGSQAGLKKLKAMGFEVMLVTSRKGYVRAITYEWMKRWGYFDLYDGYFFDDREIGGVKSKVQNVGKVGSDIHIDDNWPTVVELAKNYPKMSVWYFNPSKSPLTLQRRAGKGDLSNIKVFESWKQIIEKLR